MKILLAYSGGLDTSVAIVWLQRQYNAEIIGFCSDVGQEEDLEGARVAPEHVRIGGTQLGERQEARVGRRGVQRVTHALELRRWRVRRGREPEAKGRAASSREMRWPGVGREHPVAAARLGAQPSLRT